MRREQEVSRKTNIFSGQALCFLGMIRHKMYGYSLAGVIRLLWVVDRDIESYGESGVTTLTIPTTH